jgi:hypothetical protein
MLKDIQVAGGWKAWLYRQIFGEKLDNPLGYMILTAFGLSYGVMVPMLGIQGSMMIIAGLIGVPMLLLCMFNQQFGVCFTKSIMRHLERALMGFYYSCVLGFSSGK